MKLIKRNVTKIILLLLIIITIVLLFLKYYLSTNQEEIKPVEENLEVLKNTKEEKIEKTTKVYIDIKGAINKPGVYELDSNKKVIDVVNLAGGLTNQADTTYINLAKKVTDEMVVIIYTKEEIKKAKEKEKLSIANDNICICPKIENDACLKNETSTSKNSSSKNNNTSKDTITSTPNSLININTATKEELQNLSGVGESKAQAIIDYRIKNGNFTKVEDILNVTGIGESIYEKIKDNITV